MNLFSYALWKRLVHTHVSLAQGPKQNCFSPNSTLKLASQRGQRTEGHLENLEELLTISPVLQRNYLLY